MMSRIHWMFNCHEVSKRVSRAMDDPPPLHQRLMIWIHHRMCKYCVDFEKQLKLLRDICFNQSWPDEPTEPGTDMPDDVRTRIKHRLKKNMASDHG